MAHLVDEQLQYIKIVKFKLLSESELKSSSSFIPSSLTFSSNPENQTLILCSPDKMSITDFFNTFIKLINNINYFTNYYNENKDTKFQGKKLDIIYNFPNNIAFGHSINLNRLHNKEHLLVTKYFADLTVYFTDQNNNFIYFMNSVVT